MTKYRVVAYLIWNAQPVHKDLNAETLRFAEWTKIYLSARLCDLCISAFFCALGSARSASLPIFNLGGAARPSLATSEGRQRRPIHLMLVELALRARRGAHGVTRPTRLRFREN